MLHEEAGTEAEKALMPTLRHTTGLGIINEGMFLATELLWMLLVVFSP